MIFIRVYVVQALNLSTDAIITRKRTGFFENYFNRLNRTKTLMAFGINFYTRFGKRAFDVCAATAAIVLILPLITIVALCIAVSDRGPILFLQKRMGINFSQFNLYKFRTMVAGAHTMGPSITKGTDLRITKKGHFLRKNRLDELPQLFNVLRGEMSIVGPRPEMEKYVLLFKDEYTSILSIKPGITDPAILKFNNEQETLNKYEDAEEGYIKEILPAKIILYKKYLGEISFKTDLKIIFKTIMNILI